MCREYYTIIFINQILNLWNIYSTSQHLRKYMCMYVFSSMQNYYIYITYYLFDKLVRNDDA